MSLQKVTTSVKSTAAGQIIENLDIYVDSGDALQIMHDNVIVRNIRIHHKTGDGISVESAKNVTIQNVEVINSDPPTGLAPETSTSFNNIRVFNSPGITIDHTTMRDGSSGAYLLKSPGATISNVDGYNFHGPYPRGQFVQFNESGNSTLKNFYTYNDPKNSWVEDNVSVYFSPNVTIRDGVIDGNNSRSGVGVMFEGSSEGGRVINVDAIHMGNGAFSSYSPNVTFDDTRSFDSVWADQGRGMSSSNGLQWNISSSGISILNSTYTDPGNPTNIVWDRSKGVTVQLKEDTLATPMGHLVNAWNWDGAVPQAPETPATSEPIHSDPAPARATVDATQLPAKPYPLHWPTTASILHGTDGDNTLKGGSGNEIIFGKAGSDKIYAGTGSDILLGGQGSDYFVFHTKIGTDVDVIVDFNSVRDTIRLDNDIFTKLGSSGRTINSGHFITGSSAKDSNDYVIYNKSTGALSYDADGSGAGRAVKFAHIDNGATLTYSDFWIA